ncbi:unnamed protein product [Trichobilharzia regenti]|nr:unnamed protein product [Trichobilharzia regenti]
MPPMVLYEINKQIHTLLLILMKRKMQMVSVYKIRTVALGIWSV